MVDPPRRGEVWEYVGGSHQYRILIISSDEYNELPAAIPWALVLERDAEGIPGYLIPLSTSDPMPGAVVVIPRVFRIDPSALRRRLGEVGESTMRAVERGLREFLDL